MTVVHLHPPSANRSEPVPFRLGVNYWPREKGVTLWKNFDIYEVHSDMNTIAELGLDVVRVFLTWEDFQPDPEGVNCCALARLTALCDAAAAEGLKTIITLNTGHLSGHNWPPPWLLDTQAKPFDDRPVVTMGQRIQGGYRDPYMDPMARKAALRLVRAIARTLSDHRAVWAYDLGNSPNFFARPTDSSVVHDWYVELTETLRTLDDNHAITCGLCAQSLFAESASRAEDAYASSNFASIQVSPYEVTLEPYLLDADFVPFSCAMTTALSGKPCFVSEWGLSTAPLAHLTQGTPISSSSSHGVLATERAASDFAEEVLPKLVEVGALGALLGNYSDVGASLYGRPPYDTSEHERHRGLFRADGTTKPHGQVIRRFAETNPLVQSPPSRRAMLDISIDEFYENPRSHSQRFYETFLAQDSGRISEKRLEPMR
jgi:endo-1,4-beta-mannosidase